MGDLQASQPTLPLPNLAPEQPSGWSDKVVVTKQEGSCTDSDSLCESDVLYVNFSVTNNGQAPVSTIFSIGLYVDNQLVGNCGASLPFAVGQCCTTTDLNIGQLTAGTHTIALIADTTGAVDESNECDNVYCRTIVVDNSNGPANDIFANRATIDGLSVTLTGTNAGASKETNEPDHADNIGGKSVWWTWTAPTSGHVALNSIGSNFDTTLGVYTGNSVTMLTPVTSDDENGGSFTSQMGFFATEGTSYQIALDGFNGASGDYVLDLVLTPQPTLSIDNVTTSEGDNGVTTLEFTISMSGENTQGASVDFITADGTASAASDYVQAGGTRTWAPGDTSPKMIRVTIKGDTLVEPDETLYVKLTNPQNATLANDQGVGVIEDNDVSLAIASNDAWKSEGNSGATSFTFTITRTGVLTGVTTVNYTVKGSGAHPANAADFGGTFPTGQITFWPGQAILDLILDVSGDTTVEPDETFTVTLAEPSDNAQISFDAATGTILADDHAPPTFVLTGPNAAACAANDCAQIKWNSTGTTTGDTVQLFYDRDNVWNGNELCICESVDATACGYTWHTPANLSPGVYYLAGRMSSGDTTIDSRLTQPLTVPVPTFRLTKPNIGTNNTGASVLIQWNATGMASSDKVTLFYDRDALWNHNEIAIEVDQATASAGSYLWTIPKNLASGTYYIGGYLYSGNRPYYSHLDLGFSIENVPPGFALGGPTSGAYAAGTTIPIQWTATGSAANDKVTLFYDSDTKWNGNQTPIEVDKALASAGAYNWTIPAKLSSGTYYVCGYLYSGGKAYYSHLTQGILVRGADVAGPTIGSVVVAPARGIMTWNVQSSSAVSSISFAVDGHFKSVYGPYQASVGANYCGASGMLSPGTHDYVITVTDTFGNTSTYEDRVVIAGLTVSALATSNHAPSLTDGQLAPIVAEAARRWAATAQDGHTAAALTDVTVKIADLPGQVLGEAIGKTILIDRDAASHGWFVDATPRDDSEFNHLAADILTAQSKTTAADRVDLLTTVMHEMGHILGYVDNAVGDLMDATLPLGVRRMAG